MDTGWGKSSYSNPTGCCVEARQQGTVQVRDSKIPDTSPVLGFAPAAWQEFIAGIKAV